MKQINRDFYLGQLITRIENGMIQVILGTIMLDEIQLVPEFESVLNGFLFIFVLFPSVLKNVSKEIRSLFWRNNFSVMTEF